MTDQSATATLFTVEDFEIDLRRLEIRRNGEILPVEPMVFDVLAYLVRNSDRVVPKEELLDAVWGDRFVSESALTTRIKSARKVMGDDGRAQRLIKTFHGRGYRFIGEVASNAPEPPSTVPDPSVLIRFVEGRGAVKLAVGETGSGIPLLKAPNWLTHVDKDTRSPVWQHWVRDLSRKHRFIRADPRGGGLSDRDLRGVGLDDLDLWVDDLERIVESLELDRFFLLGISQGGPVCIRYALRHPERVAGMILFGTYSRGMMRRGDDVAVEAETQLGIARVAWTSNSATFRRLFASQIFPSASSEETEWFTEQIIDCVDQDTAPHLESAFYQVDISDDAAKVGVPTLVLHTVGDEAAPFSEGRRLAQLIPNATFVSLESPDHLLLERDPAWPRFMAAVEEFTERHWS